MTAAALLVAWVAQGVAFRADGEALRFAPADRMSPDDLTLLRSHKTQILGLFARAFPPAEWLFCWRNFASPGRPGYVANAVRWADVFPSVPTGARWLSTDGSTTWHSLLPDPDASLPGRPIDHQHSGPSAPTSFDSQFLLSNGRSST
jgi:hypothetical protein